MKKIHVVAAIIRDKDKILAAKRNYVNLKGFWEFPGGKVNIDEQPEIALQRELKEELNEPFLFYEQSIKNFLHFVLLFFLMIFDLQLMRLK